MWETQGTAKNINQPIIASYAEKRYFKEWIRPFTIGKIDNLTRTRRFAGISSLSLDKIDMDFPVIGDVSIDKLGEIHDGDVLKLYPDGRIQRLFEYNSEQNVLFITEKCNSLCIMCPQPQAPYDRSEEVIKILRCIPKKMLHKICLTGGEPTLGDQLFKILNLLKKYPYVEPLILTNGRKFSNRDFAKKFVEKAPLNMVYAIPLYSSIPQIHDEIVGISGAFKETIEGIYNLTRFRVPIELRIVLVKKNIFNLKELAEYIGWNLPMVIHVAFMGLEVYGRADENSNNVWVEPIEYMKKLKEAVKILDYRNIDVSIYNLPLCLLPEEIRKYNRYSISAWKQGYIFQCQECTKKSQCNGLFTTSKLIPQGIHKI